MIIGMGMIGDFPSPLDCFPSVIPLDWALFCVKDVCPIGGGGLV